MLGCVSYDRKRDLLKVTNNLNAQNYQRYILVATAVPHFDNHPLRPKPLFMNDNVRPHHARAVRDFFLR